MRYKLPDRIDPLWVANAIFAVLFLVLLSRLAIIFSGLPRHDYSGHIALAVFLQRYGFHGLVPNWNNFVLFLDYPPGFSYYMQIFLAFISDPKIALLAGLVALIILSAILTVAIAKQARMSKHNAIFFFLMINSSFPAIVNIFWGRIAETAGWIIVLFGLLVLLRWLELRPDRIFLSAIALTILLLTLVYPKILPLFGLALLGYMLKKSGTDAIRVFIASLGGFLLSAPWLVPFLLNLDNLVLRPWNTVLITYLSAPHSVFVGPFAFIYVFGLMAFSALALVKFWGTSRDHFFIPAGFLAMLGLSLLVGVLPLFMLVDPHSIAYFLIIMIALALGKEKSFGRFFLVFLTVNVFFSAIAISLPFDTLPESEPYVQLLPHVSERFTVLEHDWTFYFEPLYAYGAVYYDLNSSFDRMTEVRNMENFQIITGWGPLLDEKDCDGIMLNLKKLSVGEVIAEESVCNVLEECNFEKIKWIEKFCLLRVP